MAGRGRLGIMTVELRANSKRLKQGLLSAQHSIRRFRRGLSSVGKDMERVGAKGSRTFSIFGAVVAGVSGKMAADFQESLAKIRTEVGLTQDTIDQWRPKLLNLSEQFGKSATEMTDGLRKITSDGLRGAEAIDTLKESAKLSAIGLGDMQSIGRTLTSTLNAFSKQGLQASDAADTFLATVRYGNVNAERLAQSLSKVIGIGSSLGTSFKDIGSFFATLTRIGTPLSQASTALRGIFRAFIKHSKQAGEALANMSEKTLGTQLTFADLREELSQKGLLSVLQTLRKVTDNNTASWAKLFPRMRGLVGVLGTISTQAQTYSNIAGEMADNTGMVDEAMQTISKTIKYKFKVALRKLQNAGIKLGTAMFPIFTKIINAVGAMGKAFSSLGPGMTSAIGYFTAFVTAVFPLTWIFGKIISGIVGFVGIAETLSTYVGVLTAEIFGLAGAFTALDVAIAATGIGAIIAGLTAIGIHAYKSYQQTKKLHDVLENLDKVSLKQINKSIAELQTKLNRNAGFGLLDKILGNTSHFKKELNALIKRKRELIKAPAIHPGVTQSAGNILGSMGLLPDQIINGPQAPSLIIKPKVKVKPKTGRGGGISKAVQKIYDDLSKKLSIISFKAKNLDLFPNFKSIQSKTRAIQNALIELIKKGVDPASKKFQELAEKIRNPFRNAENPIKRVTDIANVSVSKPIEIPVKLKMATGGGDSTGWLQGQADKLNDVMTQIREANIGPFMTKMISMVSNGIGQLSFKIGEAIGGLADGSKNIFQSLIEIIIQSAKQLGSILLSIGTAMALVPIPGVQGTGTKYIIAGAAIMAAAGLASSLINKNGSGGGPGGGFSYSNTPGMKEGGIVPAGYPNDTYPAMLTSGEQVTPPHKLPSGGGSMDYGRLQMAFERAFNKAHITADGDSLRLVINNAQAFGR